jgi:hypothetical protein
MILCAREDYQTSRRRIEIPFELEERKEMVRKDLSRNLAQYSKPAVSINFMKEMRTA